MAATYDDIENRQRGADKQISDLANLQLQDAVAEDEADMLKAEDDASQQEDNAMTEDALSVIEEMERLSAEGEDHTAYFENLPPVIQARVSELLSGSLNDAKAEQQELDKRQGFSPLEGGQQQAQPVPQDGIPMEEPQGIPQEQNANITDRARSIASL